MRLATPLAIIVLAAALLAGCGDSSDMASEAGTTPAPQAKGSSAPAGATAKSCQVKSAGTKDLRATGLGCKQARQLVDRWKRSGDCATPPDASRSSCSLAPYRCLAAVTDRGLMVSCARPEESVAFTVKRD